jgi:hypothetical protein
MIGGTQGILGEWGVERSGNKYEGPVTVRDMLWLKEKTPLRCA